MESKCKSTYYYTDINGNKGVSEHCYEQEDNYICRDIKHIKKVIEVKEKKVCT